jgi:hypothetical protein
MFQSFQELQKINSIFPSFEKQPCSHAILEIDNEWNKDDKNIDFYYKLSTQP